MGNAKEFLLYKSAIDYNGDGKDNVVDDVQDGYDTMARKGVIPAALIGAIAAYKAKGLKNKTVHGLAGIGTGFVGTFGAKAGYDAYQRHKEKKEQELLAQLQQGM